MSQSQTDSYMEFLVSSLKSLSLELNEVMEMGAMFRLKHSKGDALFSVETVLVRIFEEPDKLSSLHILERGGTDVEVEGVSFGSQDGNLTIEGVSYELSSRGFTYILGIRTGGGDD